MFLLTLRPGEIGVDDEWLIRRYNLTTSYDTDHLMNGDIIGLFHNITNKPALYSHAVLLGDGSQEVSCFGDGSENNNKMCIRDSICSDLEIDSENDVWILVETNGKGKNEVDPVPLNNIGGLHKKRD
ncbi:hypothetical protein GLOIN_2v1792406 [Rhizophagus irregularis DAOM 181602=DAOM 197198]|uniref:MIR domain-containing protein n=1 Tax=Rhizophagus irregularis (strain DAOM 181602 / DAOM 197198 / MUCL 43194) TaxID=747089 RepID=A0A2P4NJY3_RHIID|nr:hypothetical protein GLOIN_2v1792406 [Rhizophagus irregularis DAOM 181602=DAOM 197198]POG53447.1 hypothetical protein GLOIN_2v1792406 [Rhizophagus irregularis DAOM 181602=DAOM 197198]|eukprot:XP_025164054.1 hypothetical protein GLOIN_2v1792406 [Rhizophagus irregularis DAOM 181602=DAOM 197198]